MARKIDLDLERDWYLDSEEVLEGFRERYGSHRAGRWEDDPEMQEYEDVLELGEVLAGRV